VSDVTNMKSINEFSDEVSLTNSIMYR